MLHFRNGQFLTKQKCYSQDEKQRIEALGGTVIHWGTWRVNGQLAVSRAIGKFYTRLSSLLRHLFSLQIYFLYGVYPRVVVPNRGVEAFGVPSVNIYQWTLALFYFVYGCCQINPKKVEKEQKWGINSCCIQQKSWV